MLELINKGKGDLPTKLNLGCGKKFLQDYVNVDTNIGKLMDKDCWIFEGEIKSPQDLPSNWFEYISAEMVMEHIHPDLIPNLLYCLYNMMSTEGKLEIIVPNFLTLSKTLVINETKSPSLSFNEFKIIREINNEMLMPYMGEELGMAHQSIWTPKMAKYWLNSEGFDIKSIKEFGYNNFHLKIIATKSEGNNYASPTL